MVQIRFEVSEEIHRSMQQAKLDYKASSWAELMEKLMESIYGREEVKEEKPPK